MEKLASIPDSPEAMAKLDAMVADQADVKFCAKNPAGWLAYHQRKDRKKFIGQTYLITFTRNPSSRFSPDEWLTRVKRELKKTFIITVKAVLEHPDTNMHVHAIVTTNRLIARVVPGKKHQHFYAFVRDYGHVDIQRINVDNGVENYIAKEAKPYSDPEELTFDQK